MRDKKGIIIFAFICLFLLNVSSIYSGYKKKNILDFSKVGVYGGAGNAKFYDFSVYSINVPNEVSPLKHVESWRKYIHGASEVGKITLPRISFWHWEDIYKPPSESFQTYAKRLDLALKSIDLEEIYGICLDEENADWDRRRRDMLNKLYDYVKSNYHIPVYQWYNPGDTPHFSQKADGWILNPYRATNPKFRKILQKYLIWGKPVICCIWADGAKGAYLKKHLEKQKQAFKDQVNTCKEFNVPIFFYCTAPMSVNQWLTSQEPVASEFRKMVYEVVKEAHKISPGELPLPSANFSEGRKIEISGDIEGKYIYQENFDSYKFIDDANIEGFLNLRLDGRKKALRVLSFPYKKGVSLTYKFYSVFNIHNIETVVDINYLSEKSRCEVSFSKDGKNWMKKTRETTGIWEISYNSEPTKNLWIKISFPPSGEKDYLVAELNKLGIKAKIKVKKHDEVLLQPDEQGQVRWVEDFQSQKYLHLTHKIFGPDDLIWQPGRLSIRGAKGRRVESKLIYKFVSPKPLSDIVIELKCSANSPNLGGVNKISVSLNGKNWEYTDTTKNKKTNKIGTFAGVLKIDLSKKPKYSHIKELWVCIEMINCSYIRSNISNSLYSLMIEGKVSK